MRLYHFIGAEHGLEAIKNQRLKASTLDDLNDPFELYSIDMSSSKEFRDAMVVHKSYLAHKWCMLCFSKDWHSPLLWSHYGERHKGMALEFEVPDSQIEHIHYSQHRIMISEAAVPGKDTTRRLLTTKYSEWAYEREARIFKLGSEAIFESNFRFVPFDATLLLTGVILGLLSKLTCQEIGNLLPPNSDVKLTKSRISFYTFDIVEDKICHTQK